MLTADGCASSSSNPGVLLLQRLGPGRAERVAVAMFGLSLVWACSSAEMSTSSVRISMR